jgi:putative phosphoribosyl transferase
MIAIVFRDRVDAGQRLGRALVDIVGGPATVLGIARGGVIIALEVARVLEAELDVVIPRKLGAPGNPELGIGAVAPGVRVIDERAMRMLRVSPSYVDAEVERQEAEIQRRLRAYRGDRPGPDLEGTTIVVDDGVATGVTAVAALRWARGQGASPLVFAAPVGPAGVESRLASECDRCVVLETPGNLRAVGQWYRVFDQTTDDEVRAALRRTGAQ